MPDVLPVSTVPHPDEIVGQLRLRSPFDRMEEDHLRWMADRFRHQFYPQGSIVLTPEDLPTRLYFILDGTVRVEAMGEMSPEKKVLAELVAGECFPLEALQESRPVFSTWRAESDTRCLELSLEDFSGLKEVSTYFDGFCRKRAAAFLDTSRRAFQSYFSQKEEDLFSLTTSLSLLMRTNPVTCPPDLPLGEALSIMDRLEINTLIIIDGQQRPIGIFTLYDVLRRVALPRAEMDQPISEVMSPNPRAFPPDASGYEAALAMAQQGSQHILVVDQGRLVGLLSEKDLFSLQRVGMSQVRAQIQTARDLGTLQQLSREIQYLANNLLTQGVAAEQLTRIISTLNDHLTCRVIELELEDVDLRGTRFCWIAIGSEGRLEQTLSTDQDNGVIFAPADSVNPDEVRRQLVPIAWRINLALDSCGFPLCKGNVMASNPEWCLSLDEWKKKFSSWLNRPDPGALLNATIFFDCRYLYGDKGLADALADWFIASAPQKDMFLHNIAENALKRTPPIGFFRDFVVDQEREHPNTIDLKLRGITLFVDAARILGLSHGVNHSNTALRLRHVAERLKIPEREVNAWIEAFYFIQMLRLRRQHELSRKGEPMHNRINPYDLNDLDRKFFLEALRQARKLQKRLSSSFSQGGI